MTLTLHDVPQPIQEELRRRAEAEKKTVDQVALDVLAKGLDLPPAPVKRRDLSDLAGTWVDDPGFDEAMRDQDRVDPEMWK